MVAETTAEDVLTKADDVLEAENSLPNTNHVDESIDSSALDGQPAGDTQVAPTNE